MNKDAASPVQRTEKISFQFDGIEVGAFEGETIAAALLRARITHLRDAPNSKKPRGMFCVMGVCQECVVIVDGKIVEACRSKASDGLIVNRVHYV